MTKQKKPLIEEHEYQDGDILIYIMGVAIFFAAIIIFWPYVTASAETIKGGPVISFVKLESLAPEQSYDDQKILDLWKHNQKCDCEIKELTLQQYIWNYLTIEMGLSDYAAAGIFGNMMVECGSRSFNLQPYIYSPGNSYYGLCQWNTFGHHSSINGGTLDEQLTYLAETIEREMGSYQYGRFVNADSPESAADIFGQWYERCSSPYGRRNEARAAYERFAT